MGEKRAVIMSKHKRSEHIRDVPLEELTIQCEICGDSITFLHYPGSFYSTICKRPACQDVQTQRKRQENRERVARHRAQKRGQQQEPIVVTASLSVPSKSSTLFALLDTIPSERTGIVTWAKSASQVLSIPTEQLAYRLALHRDALIDHGVRLAQSTRHRTLFIPTLGEDSGAYYSHIWKEKPSE